MSLCKMCGKQPPSVDSHIIPKAFFMGLRGADGAPPILVAQRTPGVPPKKSPIGVYDSGILCAGCELLFQDIDDYGIKVLLKEFETRFERRASGDGPAFYISSAIDSVMLLRFLVSVLWRASVSTQELYDHVSLGEVEGTAMSVITKPDAPIPSRFAAVLFRWAATPATEAVVDSILAPFHVTLDGVQCVRLYLGRVVALVKLDDEPFTVAARGLQIGTHGKVVLAEMQFVNSRQLGTIIDSIESSNAARGSLKRSKRRQPGT